MEHRNELREEGRLPTRKSWNSRAWTAQFGGYWLLEFLPQYEFFLSMGCLDLLGYSCEQLRFLFPLHGLIPQDLEKGAQVGLARQPDMAGTDLGVEDSSDKPHSLLPGGVCTGNRAMVGEGQLLLSFLCQGDGAFILWKQTLILGSGGVVSPTTRWVRQPPSK